MLRAFIVDDEPLARDELKYLLLRSKQVEIVGEADCIEDTLEQISSVKPDVVFLDIELAEDSGLELAKQLLTFNPTPAIVFATAYDEYALKSFEVNVVDYILKPFNEKRIQQTLEKVHSLQRVPEKDSQATPFVIPVEQFGRIAVLVEERIVLIDCQIIAYLGSSEGKCAIKTLECEYKVGDSLIMLEKKLNPHRFIRVHRGFIVNIDHISEIQPWFNSTYNLIMKEGSKIPVSRTYVKDLKKILGF
ncbi:LytR/AlgR family response regulator transcription factor [Paenibacillus sp. IHBB 10380]|uniref:LytR/AlgR family response regulator transcription factor n=1 Tax=Paenibacillus sp. IHBB 10380 TaxID=1566358 RepID=UPI0005CFC7DF|nr:LytTR family transcriptional regulator DNA-binding domain-containing protein [Paenibacillus sp. IHBB 10380]AJS57223.1 two-component response regulator [Paenibacillus sp. IHBB 10380]